MILDIEKAVQLSAPLERVWRAITEADEIAAWFSESLHWDARTGEHGWFGWRRHGRFAVRIERFEPPRYIAWHWAREADTPLDETDTTLVEWTLAPNDDGGTALHLKESGFTTEETRREHDSGWDEELVELLEHLGEPPASVR